MSEEKLLRATLEQARAKFHGLSCAVALHLRVDERLDLEGLLEMLRDGNRMCANALGYRGPQGIQEAEARVMLEWSVVGTKAAVSARKGDSHEQS